MDFPSVCHTMPFTILITGCAGFIGINLIRRLLKTTDANIIGVDNLIVSNYPHIDDVRFRFIKWDIVEEFDSSLQIPKIDEIYHLASIVSPDKCKQHPLYVNVIGTRNMLKLAAKHSAKFLLSSTSEVYCGPLVHPQPESYCGNVNTVGERSCCAETYVYEYRRKYGIDAKVCRIFNTYGPYMEIEDGRIITNIVKQILKNKPVIINGDGKQTRSFCYIDDMIDGLILLMGSNECGPVNLGNPSTEYSVNELVRIVEKLLGTKIIKLYTDRTENDPTPDIRMAAKRLLGFRPKIGLEQGLHKTFAHFASIYPQESM